MRKKLPKENYTFPVEFYGVNSCEAVGFGIDDNQETIFLNLQVASTRKEEANIVLMIRKDVFNQMSKQINKSIKDLSNA